jgi:hypothetical protein
LPTGQPGKAIYAVELSRKPEDPVLPGTVQSHSEGTLTVYEDTEGANDGTAECEAGADLLCYQGGNVVLIFEGGAPDIAQTRLATALTKMGE